MVQETMDRSLITSIVRERKYELIYIHEQPFCFSMMKKSLWQMNIWKKNISYNKYSKDVDSNKYICIVFFVLFF